MPARGTRSRQRQNKKRNFPRRKLFLAFLVIFLPICFFVILNLTSKIWNSGEKLALAIERDNGDVDLLVVDKTADSMTVINIPGSVEVEVSNSLGKWRLKSVQKLGEKEGQLGTLLTNTLTKHFKFPVFAWASDSASGYIDGDFIGLLKAGFGGYRTNLELGDRVRLFYYILNIKNYKKENISLADTRYLKKSVISDGEEGYVVLGSIPSNLIAIFSYPEFSEKSGKVQIVDKTERRIGDKLGSVVEVVGLKIVSVKKEPEDDTDCLVEGKDIRAVELVARLWGCRAEVKNDLGFDLIINIGKAFERRY